jgi:hypothetical protein
LSAHFDRRPRQQTKQGINDSENREKYTLVVVRREKVKKRNTRLYNLDAHILLRSQMSRGSQEKEQTDRKINK